MVVLGEVLYQIPEAVTPVRDIQISICLIQHGERRRFAMPIPLRADFNPGWVRAAPNESRDARRARRLLGLAPFSEGGPAPRAGRMGGGRLRIIRDGVVRLKALGRDGRITRKPQARSEVKDQ